MTKRLIPLLAILLAVCLSKLGCSESLCDNQVLQTFAAPDNSVKIVAFQRDCGATTGFNLQFTLLRSNETISKHGAVRSFLCISGEPRFEVSWIATNRVQVRYETNHVILSQHLDTLPIQLELRELHPP